MQVGEGQHQLLSRYRARKALQSLTGILPPSGVVLGLGELRQREYTAKSGDSLLMRPIYLDPAPGQKGVPANTGAHGTISSASHKTFQKHDEWAERRNKVKALREALHAGPDEVERFLAQL